MTQDVLIPKARQRVRYSAPEVATAIGADLASVLVLAAVGRLTHGTGLSAGGVATTAWPFLLAVAGGWLGVFLARWPALSNRAAAMVLGKTLILGFVLRAVAQDETVPLSFAVVTAIVLGVLVFGWRALARAARR